MKKYKEQCAKTDLYFILNQDRDLWRRIEHEAKAHEGLYRQVLVLVLW